MRGAARRHGQGCFSKSCRGLRERCSLPKIPDNIPLSRPEIDDEDVQAVIDVLRSGRLALGPKAAEFERNIADYVGTKHAIYPNKQMTMGERGVVVAGIPAKVVRSHVRGQGPPFANPRALAGWVGHEEDEH